MPKSQPYLYARLENATPEQVQEHLDDYASSGWVLHSSSSATLNTGTDDEYLVLSLIWTAPARGGGTAFGVGVVTEL